MPPDIGFPSKVMSVVAYNGEVAAWWTVSPLVGGIGNAAAIAQCFNLSMPSNSLGIATVNMWFQVSGTMTEPPASIGQCTFWDDYGCSGNGDTSDYVPPYGACLPGSSADGELWKSARCWNNDSASPSSSTSVAGNGPSSEFNYKSRRARKTSSALFRKVRNYFSRVAEALNVANSPGPSRSVAGSGPTANVTVLSSETPSSSGTNSAARSSSTSLPVAGSPAPKKPIPTVSVVGIIVALTVLLFSLAVVSVYRRRRLRGADPPADTISPFTVPCTALVDGNGHRQRLESQLTAAQEKMASLEGLETYATPRVMGGSTARGVLRLISGKGTVRRASAGEGGSPDVEAQLRAAREQINMLLARMNAIEANTEPPPQTGGNAWTREPYIAQMRYLWFMKAAPVGNEILRQLGDRHPHPGSLTLGQVFKAQ
ncbi:hypothetical protein C8F04DRAFT_1183645 [Mycena alexandri]|uniref:Uncharacterized protein n=1 Tax=Mycena alexandri TaxID=1745969 RepID=A0AAD6SY49_9AGAR|nr:hypothetical protein C8F04DRAFT_1183645 [Mycena alexandri]